MRAAPRQMERDWRPYALAGLVAAVAAGVLRAMGRVPICDGGTVKLWHGDDEVGETRST